MYRESPEQMERRHARLRERLDKLRPLLADLHALEAEAKSIEQVLASERAAAERHLSLPMLDNLYIASPCSQSWDQMRGDDQVRFCGRCAKNVYNLSALTREQAEALVFEREGDLCARFYRRADGTILTADCPPGRKRLRRFRGVLATIVAGILTTLGLRSARLPPAKESPPASQNSFHTTLGLRSAQLPPAKEPPPASQNSFHGLIEPFRQGGWSSGSNPIWRGSQFTGFEMLAKKHKSVDQGSTYRHKP